jgi:hypothetical protein
LHDRVRVHEDEDIGVALAGAEIAAGAKALIAGLDYASSLRGSHDFPSRLAVVDNDHVLAHERVEATRECVTAVVGDNDDGSAHTRQSGSDG